MKLVKPKPDISLANKTGHFNLLTTEFGERGFKKRISNSRNGPIIEEVSSLGNLQFSMAVF